MQIVIDIPEELYRQVKDPCVESGYIATECYNAIYRGTPLPKGHGRLIDADELKETFIEPNIYLKTNEKGFWCVTSKEIRNTPTIIEADKESEVEE